LARRPQRIKKKKIASKLSKRGRKLDEKNNEPDEERDCSYVEGFGWRGQFGRGGGAEPWGKKSCAKIGSTGEIGGRSNLGRVKYP